MIPRDQLEDDDCLRACLASIFDLTALDVPHFVRDHGAMWNAEFKDWLAGRGFECVAFDNHYPRQGIYLADGWTDRDTPHMTVWRGVEMIHDPHPGKAGLTNIRRTYWIMPLDLTTPKEPDHG